MTTAPSTAHLDYLQRADVVALAAPGHASWTTAPPPLRRLERVDGVGWPDKDRPEARAARDARPPGEDLLVGLHGYKIPLAFVVAGDPERVSVSLGTWSPEPVPGVVLEGRLDLVTATLRSLYPVVDVARWDADAPSLGLPLAGIGLGVPTVKPPDAADGSAALDRLVRAMAGETWAVVVMAQPVDDAFAAQLRRAVINEMRAVQNAEQAQLAPGPLSRHYTEQLDALLRHLSLGHAVGTWRTAVYLFGDAISYHRLGTLWRATFSGERSVPEPLRVWDVTEWPRDDFERVLAWGMPDAASAPGPGLYRHPFRYQTLLNSAQLSAYVHLPRVETSGFAITAVPEFDAVPPRVRDERTVRLGRVVGRGGRIGETWYEVGMRSLTRHTLVAGVTGSGKTNTVFRLLEEVRAAGVPFLVLEPAKAEYRALLHDAAGDDVRVFTLGDESVSPVRLNPFEVPEGIPVQQHLDLLRAVFGAGFGMWTPLPQVLERCLHEVYVDKGWDLTTNRNRRLAGDGDRGAAFPTLSDLVAKVAEVVPRLGYEQKITDDIRASLTTRLDSLRTGGKGRMLDVTRSMPVEDLFDAPAIVELEQMGDDDDKAFVMALLLVRLVEHRRLSGPAGSLRHVVVVEEAHRLLAARPPRASEEHADPRGKAVEAFAQMLSEIRAYGQGVVVADQIPTRLAPDVMKNTGLKITHRVVAADDRAALAGAMAMNARQERSLTALPVGADAQAVVFGDGDDAPLVVRVPRATTARADGPPSNADVRAHMAAWAHRRGLGDIWLRSPSCAQYCAADVDVCDAAHALQHDAAVRNTFARLVLSTMEDAAALDRMWDDFTAVVRTRRRTIVDEGTLLRALAGHLADWFAQRRGAQSEWSYADTAALASELAGALIERAEGAASVAARDAFVARARRLHRRHYPPYPACDSVCAQAEPPLCLYRHTVADVVAGRRYEDAWIAADASDSARDDLRRVDTWDVCQDAAYEVIEFPEDGQSDDVRVANAAAARRTALCFAQQMVADDPHEVPERARRIVDRIRAEAGA